MALQATPSERELEGGVASSISICELRLQNIRELTGSQTHYLSEIWNYDLEIGLPSSQNTRSCVFGNVV